MDQGTSRALVALSTVWIALVSGYMIWALVSDAGLYRWLAELQIARFGAYYPKWTAILPALLLSAPAIWVLRRQAEIGAASQPAGSATEAARIGRGAQILASIGVVAGIAAIGLYVFAQTQPDGSEAAVPFNLAALAPGNPVPGHKVSIRGDVDPAASSAIGETGGAVESGTLYAGFRPDDAAKDAPLALFVEREIGRPGAATAQGFLPYQEGYLAENALPVLVLRDFEARGIRVARPHYVLRSASHGGRELYYALAAVGGLVAIVFVLIGLAAGFRARRRAQSI